MIAVYIVKVAICMTVWNVDSKKDVSGAALDSVEANITITYEFVSSDEIVVLQNAIEDDKMISNMPVKKITLQSKDVMPSPTNVNVSALSSTEIYVSWNLTTTIVWINGTMYTVQGYTVFVKQYGYNDWERQATNKKAQSMRIGRLHPYTLYTVRMVAYHSGGNGIASEYIDVKTLEGVPNSPPEDFKCSAQSDTEIRLDWTSLNSTNWQGFAKGYFVQYCVYGNGGECINVTVSSSDSQIILHHLKPYTSYKIYIQAETGAGRGSRAGCLQKTQEGVPSIGPHITKAELDPKRPLEAEIIWDRIPQEQVNGELIGYTIKWGVTRNGKYKTEYPSDIKTRKVDQYTNTFRLGNLEIDIEIKLWIVGRTSVGVGADDDSKFVLIETCKCPRNVYAAWFHNPPYVEKISSNPLQAAGIFPTYLRNMMTSLCSECNALKNAKHYNATKLWWDRSKDGRSPLRADERRLKELVNNGIHFHVAMRGRSELHNFQSEYRFVGIVHSPGIAFIVRDPLLELDKTKEIMNSLAKCWPAIIIIILFSMVSGIIMWVLDCKENHEEFPNESFLQGLYHGTYWAFVSMTTVGYGDKTPRSFVAQCVAICWMLMGPIINGIVISAITTSLTTISLQSDPKIYGSQVGAISDSFEYNLGVRRNAKMNPNGVVYSHVDELLLALENKEVNGILIDSLQAQSLGPGLAEKKMKISKIIAEKDGWGIILAGEMLKLEEEIRSYESNNAESMKQSVQNRTKELNVKGNGATDVDTGLVDPKSETFLGIVKYGLIAIGICIIVAAIFEFVILKYRRAKVVPYTEAHRALLEDNVSQIITEFCDSVPNKLKSKTDEHESELKRFFWKKGYSFGIDGWLRQKTSDEEKIKKEIRYQEIMNEDLGLYKPKVVWSQPKSVVKALKHETQKAAETMKEKIDDFI